MKRGYQLMYHKDIPIEYLQEIKRFLDEWDMYMIKGYGCRRQSCAYLRRGILGKVIDKDVSKILPECEYTFKRLSTRRRIFGVVPINRLESKVQIDLNQCRCAEHRGGQRVFFDGGFNENDFVLYMKRGDIKG